MGLYTKENNSCYFIHIPRTGGRYVRSLFFNTPNIKYKYHFFDELINEKEVSHLHYPHYNSLSGVKNTTHFTIVRNPINKFFSAVKNMGFDEVVDMDSFISNESDFKKFVMREIKVNSYHNNWFLPQYRFISPKTNIWKYENGFEENFLKWIFDKTGIELINEKVDYDKFENENKFYRHEYSDRIIGYIKKFYNKDFKLFEY